MWKLGTRGKLHDCISAKDKIEDGKALGRAIWIPDMHESILSNAISKKFLMGMSVNPQENPLMMGFNHHRDAAGLKAFTEKGSLFMNLDYSKYDSSISPSLMLAARNVIK